MDKRLGKMFAIIIILLLILILYIYVEGRFCQYYLKKDGLCVAGKVLEKYITKEGNGTRYMYITHNNDTLEHVTLGGEHRYCEVNDFYVVKY